ncbi:Cpvl [Phodopus roborovskii]|uniref:Carboxypeptidase n=1 Tax=Phodopus roborovskii TaxID=109678 RepID=A0AAV0A5E0_PHORO|nr:Cpvl [Phodopus roborovskii]
MVGIISKVIVSLILFMVSPGDGLFRSIYRSTYVSMPLRGNAGRPLFLSPYIKAGKIKEGQKKSIVSPLPGMNMKSYAGYITVNKTYNSNLFFWFFPARIQPESAPVVLWLQGGPGGSSMFGLFVEHGPYIITNNMTVLARDFPWTTTLSMLYVDNPVGTGFSFTDSIRGYAISEDDVAQDLYSALIQFFQLFPEYVKNAFYVTGESYAGKYVPAIAHYIHSLNPVRELKIHLEGIAIGDAYFDPESIIGGYATFLYQIGLLDEQQQQSFQNLCNKCINYIKDQNWIKAFEILDKLLDGDLTNDQSFFQNVTGCTNYYNFLECEVLLYNGQLDIIVAAVLTERSLMTMDWKGSQEYENTQRKVWKIFKSDNDVAGYVRQVNKFHQVCKHVLLHFQSFQLFHSFIYYKLKGMYSIVALWFKSPYIEIYFLALKMVIFAKIPYILLKQFHSAVVSCNSFYVN